MTKKGGIVEVQRPDKIYVMFRVVAYQTGEKRAEPILARFGESEIQRECDMANARMNLLLGCDLIGNQRNHGKVSRALAVELGLANVTYIYDEMPIEEQRIEVARAMPSGKLQ